MRGLSLRTKVFFMFAGAALAIVVPALVLIARAVERGVYERTTEEVRGAATTLTYSWSLADELLRREANAIALEAGLSETWSGGSDRALRRLLTTGLDKDRVVVAVDSAGATRVGPALVAEVLRGAGSAGTVVTRPEGSEAPLRVSLWPVMGDSGRTLGAVGVGTWLGPGTVKSFKEGLTPGTDIALFVGDSLVGLSLPDSVRDEVARIARAPLLGADRTMKRQIAGQWYLYSAYALPARGLQASVILLRPITNELRIADVIRRSLVGIGLAALILALVLAAVVSRIVARPTQALAEASARLARGDFLAPLPRAGGDEIGQLARAFGEMRSAIAEREARLRSAQAEMIHREKLAAMGRLVAQLSHELNNPIYNIQNCLEALLRRGDPSDPNREFVTLAQEELTRMASLTRRLLDQSRPLSEAAAAVDLNGLARRVLTLASTEAEGRGIRMEADLAPSLPSVVAHPDAIHQVLANLVTNALDAMPAGGTLRVSTHADDDAVEVVVEDTGTGIPDKDLPHIFEAFYTTKPGVNGIGLGLFVSDGIIRGHRGRLSVESDAGAGSRFTVRLPRQTLDESLALPDLPGAAALPAAV